MHLINGIDLNLRNLFEPWNILLCDNFSHLYYPLVKRPGIIGEIEDHKLHLSPIVITWRFRSNNSRDSFKLIVIDPEFSIKWNGAEVFSKPIGRWNELSLSS